MFTTDDDLPDDIDSLKALVLDLSRRLQNAQHTVEAERRSAHQAMEQAEYYRHRLTETTSSFRIEAARIRNLEMKYRREHDGRRYEDNKVKMGALIEELRVAELDCQIAGMTKTVPVKVSRLRSKIGSLEAEQQSLRTMLTQLSEIEQLNEKLALAAQSGNYSDAWNLLQAGTDVNYVDASGSLPLHYACQEGHVDVVRLLLEHGSDFNARLTGQAPVVLAARGGHNEVIKTLLDYGANAEEKGVAGIPPLISAFLHGRISTVQYLLEEIKVDINSLDSEENTILHHAVRSNRSDAQEVIFYLLEKGVNVERINRQGHTALQVALYDKRKAAIEILTGKKVEDIEEESNPKPAEALGRRGSTMAITSARRTVIAKPGRLRPAPVNAVPKGKHMDPHPSQQKGRNRARKPNQPSMTGLAKGSALDAPMDDLKEESSTGNILTPEALSLMASTSVASSVTFDPE
eukprot:gene7071-7821_t